MKKWNFGINNDYLVDLVIKGKKTATTCLYNFNDIPKINEKSALVYSNNEIACITITKKVIITEFKNINEEMSILEGEGNHNLWKESHIKFFKKINPNFNENTEVIFEIFDIEKG